MRGGGAGPPIRRGALCSRRQPRTDCDELVAGDGDPRRPVAFGEGHAALLRRAVEPQHRLARDGVARDAGLVLLVLLLDLVHLVGNVTVM